MSVDIHSLNATGLVDDSTSGDNFASNGGMAREPLASTPPSTVKSQVRCNLEPRERSPKLEGQGREGHGLGRLLLTVLTSLAGGCLGAWGYQQWLAPLLLAPAPTAPIVASREIKPQSTGSASVSDDADDQQNKVLDSLRADLDLLRGKLHAVQLRLNGTDTIAKPVQTPEVIELKTKIAELTIQTDKLAQLPARVRAIDERIEQVAVSLKSLREDLQTFQELSPKSVVSPRRPQAGSR